MDSKVIDREGYVAIEVCHRITMKDAKQLLDTAYKLAARSRAKPVVIYSKEAAPLSLLDLYIFARLIVETPLRKLRIAFLYEGDPDFDSSQFVQTIVRDHGMQFGVFATLPEAVQWFANTEGPR